MPPATSSSVLRRVRDEGDTAIVAAAAPNDPRIIWRERFRTVRSETERRVAPLGPEDQMVQSMPDASPTKWHRAHTTWFLEQFLLLPRLADYRVFDEQFAYLFNSYYVAAGPRHARLRPLCRRVGLEPAAAVPRAGRGEPAHALDRSGDEVHRREHRAAADRRYRRRHRRRERRARAADAGLRDPSDRGSDEDHSAARVAGS